MKPAVKDWRLASLLTKTSKMKDRSIIGNMWMHLWHMWYSDKFRIHVDFNEFKFQAPIRLWHTTKMTPWVKLYRTLSWQYIYTLYLYVHFCRCLFLIFVGLRAPNNLALDDKIDIVGTVALIVTPLLFSTRSL